jgi:hypothetical protein
MAESVRSKTVERTTVILVKRFMSVTTRVRLNPNEELWVDVARWVFPQSIRHIQPDEMERGVN